MGKASQQAKNEPPVATDTADHEKYQNHTSEADLKDDSYEIVSPNLDSSADNNTRDDQNRNNQASKHADSEPRPLFGSAELDQSVSFDGKIRGIANDNDDVDLEQLAEAMFAPGDVNINESTAKDDRHASAFEEYIGGHVEDEMINNDASEADGHSSDKPGAEDKQEGSSPTAGGNRKRSRRALRKNRFTKSARHQRIESSDDEDGDGDDDVSDESVADDAGNADSPEHRRQQSEPKPQGQILNDEGTEYSDMTIDLKGDEKVDHLGHLKGGRRYRCKTFTLSDYGDRLFQLSSECARSLGYRDSYLMFNKNPLLRKVSLKDNQKHELIDKSMIPYSFRSRVISVITARSIFVLFGARAIVGGRRVIDDYYEQQAIDEGLTNGEAVGNDDHEYKHRSYEDIRLGEETRNNPTSDIATGHEDGADVSHSHNGRSHHKDGLFQKKSHHHKGVDDFWSSQYNAEANEEEAALLASLPPERQRFLKHIKSTKEFNKNLRYQRLLRINFWTNEYARPKPAVIADWQQLHQSQNLMYDKIIEMHNPEQVPQSEEEDEFENEES